MTFKNDTNFIEFENKIEGEDYISLVKSSRSPLGRALSINNNYLFNTLVGDVRSIGRFMSYISMKGYPYRLLLKGQFSNKDLNIIKHLPTVKLPNYWAIMCYAICCRVAQDSKLQKWLKENTLPLTICKKEIRNKYVPELSTPIMMNNNKMGNYLAIVRDIESLIKEDMFNSDTIQQLIRFYKSQPELNVFENVPILSESSELKDY